jgi:DNA-binding beta-propeller fold protein YncE
MVKKSTVVLEFLLIGAIVAGIVFFSKLKKDEPKDPVTDEPVTDEPVTDEPVTDEPVAPCGLAVGANGKIYITADDDGSAFKIDEGILSLLGNNIFNTIIDIAVDDTENVYVTGITDNEEKAFLYKIEAITNTREVVAEKFNPVRVLVSAKNNIFFIDRTEEIYKIDTLGNIEKVALNDDNIFFVNFTIDKHENIYAVNTDGIYKITSSGEVEKVANYILDPLSVAFMAVDNSAKYLYYTKDDVNSVTQVDLTNGGTIKELFLNEKFNEPLGLVVDKTGKKLYVADSGNSRVCVMSLDTEILIEVFDTKFI